MAKHKKYTVLEVCAGGGGQALGLEMAGFHPVGASEIDKDACQTLKHNRPKMKVIEGDIHALQGTDYLGTDLFAGGVPCPPFSIAGKQLGPEDERNLFPEALRLVKEIQPKAVMLENVRGLATKRFDLYREQLLQGLTELQYAVSWKILNASDFGVPQLRPRMIIIALKKEFAPFFVWPQPHPKATTVADAIGDLMLSKGWKGGKKWLITANGIAPTIVGGSKKHGGPDLGPTRARNEWAKLGVDGRGIANEIPDDNYPKDQMPRLTLNMVARIQGFPDSWVFCGGGKTSIYRQIGNAFPPPVACAVGKSLLNALNKIKSESVTDGQLQIFSAL